MAEAQLLVAIHDVAPPFAEECAALWDLCLAHEVVPALFVVPEWHGRFPIEADAPFVRWVTACVRQGADCFLHGHRHDEVGTPRDWRAQWAALGRTDGEGEFVALSADGSAERIAAGRARLTAVGLAPIGFVAPAWLASRAVHQAAARCGLPLTEDADGVRSCRTGQLLPAPAVRWSTRTRWRATLSPVVARWRRAAHRRAPLARLALHPRDLHEPGVARSLRDALHWWCDRRRPLAYRDLLERLDD